MPAKPLETLFVGRHHIRLEQVESTNSFALDMLRSGSAAEGTIVSALEQTAGRGQRGNTWFSAAGLNLTFSIILRPTFLAVGQQFDLTRAVALAVADVVAQCTGSTAVCVKWPNDIYVEHRKIAGILIENVLGGSRYLSAVAGIGLNVNQNEFGELHEKATSLRQVIGDAVELDQLLPQLCLAVEHYYLQLRAGKQAELRTSYESRLYLMQQLALFRDEHGEFEARINGTSPEGVLLLTTATGEARSYLFRDIALVRPL